MLLSERSVGLPARSRFPTVAIIVCSQSAWTCASSVFHSALPFAVFGSVIQCFGNCICYFAFSCVWMYSHEAFQVAFKACSEAFGPQKGILVNDNDCIDLITAISAKRVSGTIPRKRIWGGKVRDGTALEQVVCLLNKFKASSLC